MSFDDFKNADTGEPPDGLHTARLERTSVFESQKGDWFIRTCWRTADNAYYWESLHGTTNRGKQYTQELINALGVTFATLGSWDALGDALAAREGTLYEVAVAHRGEFVNTTVEDMPQGVQAALPDMPVDTSDFDKTPAAAGGIFDDDDIPF